MKEKLLFFEFSYLNLDDLTYDTLKIEAYKSLK